MNEQPSFYGKLKIVTSLYRCWITMARYILIVREIQWTLINFYGHSSWFFLIVIRDDIHNRQS